jgi:hypothetical protein
VEDEGSVGLDGEFWVRGDSLSGIWQGANEVAREIVRGYLEG